MELEKIFNDSLGYTRETFAGHWIRWLIFILLGLPFSLIRFFVDPAKIIEGATIRWDLIPWGSMAALVIAGILASFFLSGYMVRIYRGMKPAPDFTGWAALFIDGIKLDIVMLGWFLPGIILVLFVLLVALGGVIWPGMYAYSGSTPIILISIAVLSLIAMGLFIIGALYAVPGAVRFSRAGSMREGWRFKALTGIIRRIGWGNYIIALFVFSVASLLFTFLISLPAAIPYIGWLVPVCLSPLLTVFAARFYMLVYETGEPLQAAPPAP
jgi:hypothetical protein